MIELPVTRLREDAVLPARAYVGDAGLDLVACERHELGPGERALVGTGIAVAIPEGHAGLVAPRSGLAVEHGITIVNTPGIVDSGYRGELRVILHNTDRRETFVVEPGMRIAAARRASAVVPRVEQLARGGDGFARGLSERGAGRLRLCPARAGMSAEPRIRVSALLHWKGRILLCRHEKGEKEYWLLPGGGVNSGESLVDALRRELAEEVGIHDNVPIEGPIAIVDSIAPATSYAAKHVVHIIFSGDLGGRSLEAVTSADAAVRGHRLFGLDRARGDRPAPADPALSRALAARRPDRVPRPALGALEAAAARLRAPAAETACACASSASSSGSKTGALAGLGARRPARAASRRARGCAAAAGRAGTCRPRGRRGSPRSRSRRRCRSPRPRVRAARRPRRGSCARRGSRIRQASAAARSNVALEQDVADHPPLAGDGVERQHAGAGQVAAVAVAVKPAEQLVAAADGEHRGAAGDGLLQRLALGRDVGRDQRLLAVLPAADVVEVVRAGLDGVAESDRRDVELEAARQRARLRARRCCRGRHRCSGSRGRGGRPTDPHAALAPSTGRTCSAPGDDRASASIAV